jgi:hypothetical protein
MAYNSEKQKWYDINRCFGLSREGWEKIYSHQEEKCLSCKRTISQVKELFPHDHFCVDHSHETYHIRGLLCSKCNMVLGHIENYILSPFLSEKKEEQFSIMVNNLFHIINKENNYGLIPMDEKSVKRRLSRWGTGR